MCLTHILTGNLSKGREVGSGSPNYRLTKVVSLLPDETIFRSVRVSPLVGGMTDMQNDLAYSVSAPGQQGDRGLYLGGNIVLGRLNYGLGAQLQVQSGSQSHTLRGEGPELHLERYSREQCYPRGQIQVALNLRLDGYRPGSRSYAARGSELA
jgi:hypothetical protein